MCSPSVSLREFQPSFGFTESDLAVPCKTGSMAAIVNRKMFVHLTFLAHSTLQCVMA